MRLKNKKTGQIGNFIINKDHFECVDLDYGAEYRTLAELNAEWTDAPEEPEEFFWFVNDVGEVEAIEEDDSEETENAKQIGNYFGTKEEAELAVRKLKAWKRLRDKEFEFVGCWKDNTIDFEFVGHPLSYDEAEEAERDLAFLFGGEE